MSTTASIDPTTCDGSPRTTSALLGRIQATLGRLTGHPPPSDEAEDAAPVLVAEDDEE